MYKLKQIIIINIVLIIGILIGISYYQVQASESIQSKGKLIYNDGNGNEIVIDTQDHEILQDNIDSLSTSIENKNTWKFLGRITSATPLTASAPLDTKEILVVARTPFYCFTANLPGRNLAPFFFGNRTHGVVIDGGKLLEAYQDDVINTSNAYADVYYR